MYTMVVKNVDTAVKDYEKILHITPEGVLSGIYHRAGWPCSLPRLAPGLS